MIQIAICDDDHRELAVAVAYTEEFLQANKLTAGLRQFAHPDALLTACEKERFSIYLLDIVMPMVDGIAVGRAIRRIDREAQIIYATSEPSFALDAYAANPVNFLLKPIDKAQFFDTLTLAVSRLDLAGDATITVKTKVGLRVLRISDICSCEYQNHAVIYTVLGGEAVMTRTLSENFSEHTQLLLQNIRFLRPHASYVINMRYVERFSKDSFTMRGGAVIPIAVHRYTDARSAYMTYLMAKESTG